MISLEVEGSTRSLSLREVIVYGRFLSTANPLQLQLAAGWAHTCARNDLSISG